MPCTGATCVGQDVLSWHSFEQTPKLCIRSPMWLLILESGVRLARHIPGPSAIVRSAGKAAVTWKEEKSWPDSAEVERFTRLQPTPLLAYILCLLSWKRCPVPRVPNRNPPARHACNKRLRAWLRFVTCCPSSPVFVARRARDKKGKGPCERRLTTTRSHTVPNLLVLSLFPSVSGTEQDIGICPPLGRSRSGAANRPLTSPLVGEQS